MTFFEWGYNKVMKWAGCPEASWYLGTLSFAEALICPIPVEAMLIPMVLSKPKQALPYGVLATLTSVLGGVVGYWLGYWAFEPIVQPVLNGLGYLEYFQTVSKWFLHFGFLVIFIAGFSPIPFKVFTVAAGVVGMLFASFVFAALLARGLRFILIAGLVAWGGKRLETFIRIYCNRIGWLGVGMVMVYIVFKGLHFI